MSNKVSKVLLQNVLNVHIGAAVLKEPSCLQVKHTSVSRGLEALAVNNYCNFRSLGLQHNLTATCSHKLYSNYLIRHCLQAVEAIEYTSCFVTWLTLTK